MNRAVFFLLLLALANAFAQQRVAIVNTEDDGEPQLKVTELNYLTARLREIAAKTLPKNEYSIMTEQSMLSFFGSHESMKQKCKESESCLAKLGREINADYIGQGRIGRFGKNLTIKVELYSSASGDLISSFTGESKDIHGLLKELDKKAPAMFKELLPDAEVYYNIGKDYAEKKDYGKAMKYYKKAIELKPDYAYAYNNIGFVYAEKKDYDKAVEYYKKAVELKPDYAHAYNNIGLVYEMYNNMGNNYFYKQDYDKAIEYLKKAIQLNPGDADTYYNIGAAYGNKHYYDKAIEYFEKAIQLRPDFAQVYYFMGVIYEAKGNKAVGEQYKRKAAQMGYIATNQPVATQYVPTPAPTAPTSVAASSFRDSRDGKKYKTVKIGTQTWMAENLNYDAKGSKCYDNETENCDKYGRLYDWVTSKKACPSSWHLPNNVEWATLAKFAGGTGTHGENGTAGTKLKAKYGWNAGSDYKPGTDDYNFSALPGGGCFSGGYFSDVGVTGYWWSSNEYSSISAYDRYMFYSFESVHYNNSDKSNLFSVRCVQD